MRKFEFVEVEKDGEKVKMFEDAKLPIYATPLSAGADFFCAETVTIPPTKVVEVDCPEGEYEQSDFVVEAEPTLVHTGIKAMLEDDDALLLFNRSGNIKKRLMLANGVGVVDADYYWTDNDIMFAFYNFNSEPVTIQKGDRIGQGVIQKFYHAENAEIVTKERTGGFGSTG